MFGAPAVTRVLGKRRTAILFFAAIGLSLHPDVAGATEINADELNVVRNGTSLFDDTFLQNTTLAGGNGTILSSGLNFSTGVAANYFVRGSITETTANNGQANFNTTNGVVLSQPPPFLSSIQETSAFLQTNNTGTATTLGNTTTFGVTGLFDLSAPSVVDGTYALVLTNRLSANNQTGNVLQLRVRDCAAGSGLCGGDTGIVLQYVWLDYINNTDALISEVLLSPADLANAQLEFNFAKANGSSDVICGSYALGTGNTLGSFSGSVTGSLGCTDSATDVFNSIEVGGETVLAGINTFDPVSVPEPSSLALMFSGLFAIAGFSWTRRRRIV